MVNYNQELGVFGELIATKVGVTPSKTVGRDKKWRLEEKLAGRALVGNEKIIRELRVSR